MKYIYNRVIAYIIDMLIVVVVATLLSKIGFINPNLSEYTKYSDLYSKLNLNYQNYVTDLQKYYSDGELSDKEYNKIVEKYGDVANPLIEEYSKGDFSKKEYDKVLDETNKSFMKQNKKLYYKVNKYSLVYNIIVTLCIVLYFVLFNVVTDGQTLGKRLLRLRIVDVNDGKVSVISYILRCIILYGPLYYVLLIICPYFLNLNDFYRLALVISSLKNYLTVIVFAFIMFRKDNRGLHDIVAKTKVIEVEAKKKEELEVEFIQDSKKKGKKTVIESKKK